MTIHKKSLSTLGMLLVLACSPDDEAQRTETEGSGGTRAATTTGGVGAQPGSGGTAIGGSATGGVVATGGAVATGGLVTTGGVVTTGGAIATGGLVTTGGVVTTGGTATGGTATGGTATGGEATGGSTPTGGVGAGGTGGVEATGGAPPTGGNSSTGGAQVCTWPEAPSSADGELTCYWFSQGTAANFPECAEYKTYCGYCGTETGERGTSEDICPVYDVQNHVDNISTTHFAAFPLGDFQQGGLCGMCVEVTYNGRTIVATIVDACGSCNSGHIDLSLSAAEALGMTGWNGNPTEGVSWRAVGCPATGDIYATFNGNDPSYRSQVYFQNPAFPIVSAEAAGRTATMNNAFWDFGTHVAGETVTLTDVVGHTITGTIPTAEAGGSIGAQFDLTCQ